MAGVAAPGASGPALVQDAQALAALKHRAATDPRGATRAAARQLESLFMQELMKSMRATTLQSAEGGTHGAMGTDMLDTQFAQQLSGMPGGLSEAIARHLERQMGLAPGPVSTTPRIDPAAPAETGKAAIEPVRLPQKGAAGFVQRHDAAARAAQAQSGIPASFMVAQAAHETGWGRKEILHADGSPSFNLFGIKAGSNWKGPVAEITTTEYVNGRAQKVTARFRAYGSYAESFADYARLIKETPRYREAYAAAQRAHGGEGVAANGFAAGLQRAGYATDPAYADKLTRVINTTLRLQRSGAA